MKGQGGELVLLVEDDPGYRSLLESLLAPHFELLAVESAEEAQSILSARTVDLILCDHVLPGENGIDFLARIRQGHGDVERILLTGMSDRDEILAAVNRAGVRRYLVKPCPMKDVLAAVRDALLQRRRKRELVDENRRLKTENEAVPRAVRKLNMLTRAASRLGLEGMSTTVLLFALILVLGMVVLTTLYGLKVFLDIDLIKDSHVSDWL